MHDPYDDDEDDGYDDDYYNYDHNDQYDPYKFYFKFDMNNAPLSDWITKMINDIVNKDFNIDKMIVFPVNSWNPDTVNNKFQYLGSNYQGNQIWKKKYFLSDPLNTEYKLHLQAHAKHFVLQPTYYQGLFDILN